MKTTMHCPRCGEADSLWLKGPKVNLFDGMVTLSFYCSSFECRTCRAEDFDVVFTNTKRSNPYDSTVTQEVILR